MQITRLQLIILLIGLGCAGFAIYSWVVPHQTAPVPHHTPPPITPIITTPLPVRASTPAPLSTAQRPPSETPTPEPTSSAPDKESEVYEVVRGDTLWRIARDHSPVHQGPGWVKIWKVNKKTVKNFDQLEVGWSLQIPPDPTVYATAFWKPRLMAKRYGKIHDQSVDLAQLPIPAAFAPNEPGWPPEMPHALEVVLLKNEPMPHALEVALLQSSAMPQDLILAFARLEPSKPDMAEMHLAQEPRSEIVLEEPKGGDLIASVRLVPTTFMTSTQFR